MSTQAHLHTVEAALGAFTSVTGVGAHILKRKPKTPFSALVKFELDGGFQCPILTTASIDRDERLAAIAATARLRSSTEFVLVAPYLTASLIDACTRLGIQAIDESGNACLRHGQSRILVSGRPRAGKARAPKKHLWTKSTLRAALSLLVDPELVSRGVRQVSDIAGVSVGTAHRALQTLVERGDVKARSNGDYFYPRFREWVDEWAVLYPTTLRDSLLLGRFSAMTPDWWQQITPSPNEWKFGGEPGAALLTGYLKPGVVTIYCTDSIPKSLIASARLRADPSGDIELLKAPIPLRALNADASAVVHPVLIYADLVASRDPRNMETARVVYDEFISSKTAG